MLPDPQPADIRRWRRHLADEYAEAAIYRDLAERRTGEEREILLALADAEARHAAHWTELLGEHAEGVRPGVRVRLLHGLARRFGSVFVLAMAQRAESRTRYVTDADATPTMAADERIHEEVIRALAARGRNRLAGSFRAAVFGANDGLVSNLALVLGIGGAGAATGTVLLSGVAGLLAGALSMGAGEYVSVRSQRELLEATAPDDSAHDVVPYLDVDANELALVYRARGVDPEAAQAQADEAIRRWSAGAAGPTEAPSGPDHEAIGTAWAAAGSSFCFFASGAIIPVLPFLFGLEGGLALGVATAATGVALVVTGWLVGLLSGAPPLRRAARQLAIGLGAAGVTYVLGMAFGTVIG